MNHYFIVQLIVPLTILCLADNFKFTKEIRAYEVECGRFLHLKKAERAKAPTPEWVASKAILGKIDALLAQLRSPKAWPRLKSIFADKSSYVQLIVPLYNPMCCVQLIVSFLRLKIADTLELCSDTGAYLFQFLDIQEELRDLLVDTLLILSQMRSKLPRERAEAKALHQQLMVKKTKLEMMLPLLFSSFTKHGLEHLHEQFERAGCFWAYNMLPFERWHVLLKSLVRGSKNVLASIQHNFEVCCTIICAAYK